MYYIETKEKTSFGLIELKFELPLDESQKEETIQDIKEKINELAVSIEEIKTKLEPNIKEKKPCEYTI